MKNVQASQDCFGKISIDRIKNCCCSAWKMSNFRNEDRSHQVENAGYAEFERVSKTQQFFDIFLASSWAWALFENVSYKMFCKNVHKYQSSDLPTLCYSGLELCSTGAVGAWSPWHPRILRFLILTYISKYSEVPDKRVSIPAKVLWLLGTSEY